MSEPGNTRPSLETLKDKKNLIGVEIGVYDGDNARHILDILDIQQLVLVDHWGSHIQYNLVKEAFHGDARVQILSLYSSNAYHHFEDDYFDFVYIDANHEYEYVVEDIKLWTPKVKKGGLIAGHDYISSPGVRLAVIEAYGVFNQKKEDWWIIKGGDK